MATWRPLADAGSTNILAECDYGPFGEVIRATGPMAKANPFRFSTKYQDDETDLLYYVHRYLNTSTGRWINRDPIEENGGWNLYGLVGNDCIDQFDLFGLWGGSDHERMTRGAWETVTLPSAYKGKMADLLVKENKRVDDEWMDDNYWHFNRGLKEDVTTAKTAYISKLCGKENEVQTYLANPSLSSCEKAFRVMGNLSHAFQDYYSHAIDIKSDGSAMTIGLVTGTPDSPGQSMKPASWGGVGDSGEHKWSEPGNRAPDAASRKNQAKSYTASKLQPFASNWWHACKCYAKDIFGQ